MRLDNQDINGLIPVLKRGIREHFHIQMDAVRLFMKDSQIHFDGQGTYKGISFKVDGLCTITYQKNHFMISFKNGIIRNTFMNLDLEAFIQQFLKETQEIFFKNNVLYIKITILPIAISIVNFEVNNDEIITYFTLI